MSSLQVRRVVMRKKDVGKGVDALTGRGNQEVRAKRWEIRYLQCSSI